MVRPKIEFSLTETEQTKLHEAARLIREVVRSVDDYYREDERLDTVSQDTGSTSLLRLVVLAIEDELKKHSLAHPEVPNLS